jgi:hypothetical protein
MNAFSKACLVIIILLLAFIALRPVVSPQPAFAASHYRYLVVTTKNTDLSLQQELDKHAAAGWELAVPLNFEQSNLVTLIYRKQTRGFQRAPLVLCESGQVLVNSIPLNVKYYFTFPSTPLLGT